MSQSKIGVFDSGVGGLTVLNQLIQLLPHESFVYFGDTARLPYGEKSGETIIRYSIENTQRLLTKDIKLIVVACNTASSYALDHLRECVDIPVIGVIEPGVKHALKVSQQKCIAVLGTKATILSDSYQRTIKEHDPEAQIVSIACPLLVPLIEEAYGDHLATRLIVREYLQPLKKHPVDTLLLGCTHYPLLQELIQSEIDANIQIIDSALACAEYVKNVLIQNSIGASAGSLQELFYMVSDDPHKFQNLGRSLLKLSIDHVEHVRNNQETYAEHY